MRFQEGVEGVDVVTIENDTIVETLSQGDIVRCIYKNNE